LALKRREVAGRFSDIIYSLYEQRTVLGLLPLLVSSCNHEQGLGRELGAARAGLVAPVGAGHYCFFERFI
jgi:hypothetical protein